MLWLYDKNNIIDFEFFQVFMNSNIVYDDDNNTIYSLETINTEQNNIENDINVNKIKCDEYLFDIKIIDNLISYTSINNSNQQLVFTFKMNFIKPTENELNLPIFNFTYKKVNKKRMPNLIDSHYNFYSSLKFKIFKINDKVQFIIETNPNDKFSIKKYFITTDLNLIKNYI